LDRRTFVVGAVALTASSALRAGHMTFATLEAAHGGRLGVAALDSATGERMSHRADERFPLCSTFKLLAASAILKQVDIGKEHLGRVIAYDQADLLEYAPVTRANVGLGGMSIGDLCAAAMTLSDNTAGNLLLTQLGGPAGLTRYVRSLGDGVTRLDRNEPSLNTALPGDPRDTTSPSAMLSDLNRLLIGDGLSKDSRSILLKWMRDCKTASNRIPAGLPSGWRSGDKTGSGDRGTANDVAIIERPAAAPILVAAYYTGSSGSASERDGVLKDVGRIVCRQFGGA
jgi:beta-lactamase class A